MKNDYGKTILLVEDEAIIAIAGKKSLEKYGYNVIIANSGDRAIEIFKNDDRIDLVLMDIDLGSDIDGTETAVCLLKERIVPVVFLSSHTEPEVVARTEKITSYGYVVKNSGITVLDASIKMAFKLFDANKQIIASEEKQKAMISNISDVIGIIDSDGIIRYKSPNIARWFGWLPEDLVGNSGLLTVHPEETDRLKNEFYSIINNGNSPRIIEFRYKCKDGTYKLIELTAINLTDDPVINGVLLCYHDITERRLSEKKLSYLARLYATLSQINQVIIKAKEQDELFVKICQVAIDYGKFRMAWIGLIDDNDERIKPVARAGFEDGYLDRINITKGNQLTGQGPTGSALKEGRIIIAHDIETEPRMLPWRDEAISRGYHSSAAVPFNLNGKPAGTLNLYASESGFFTDEELKLLKEIGEDISFALDSIAMEKERKRLRDD